MPDRFPLEVTKKKTAPVFFGRPVPGKIEAGGMEGPWYKETTGMTGVGGRLINNI